MENCFIQERTNKHRLGDDFLCECTLCHKKQARIRAHRSAKGSWIFINDAGKKWEGARCPKCALALAYKRSKKRNRATYPEHPSRKKGRDAEIVAYHHFAGLGYKTKLNKSTTGPDLLVWIDGKQKKVEVKSVTKRFKNHLVVASVAKNRAGDDLIAYVYNKSVVIRDMKEHLLDCQLGGICTVSMFFNKTQ